MVTQGDIYERQIHDDHGWRTERRLVLDVTDQCVFYQIVYDEPEGTCVENDYIKDQKQVTMKEWRMWVNPARKVLSPTDMIYFAFEDDSESDFYNMFLVVKRDFWELHGHLDDQHITAQIRKQLPDGFCEVQESVFEYNGTTDEGRELLLEMGYQEKKEMLP